MTRAKLILAAALVALLLPLALGAARPMIVTTQDHSLGGSDDCNRFHTQSSTSLPAEARERIERRLPDSVPLTIRATQAGGVSVRGWDRPYAQLTVCKCAAARNDALAQALLGAVTVKTGNGLVTAEGPDGGDGAAWWAHMILRVPKTAVVDIASSNGGIAIRNMNGRITARATSGGISVVSSSGESRLRSDNGGISLERVSGQIDASTRGPISLRLGFEEDIPSLEAKLGETGEIRCRLPRCNGAGVWTANRKQLRLGARAPSIRLTSSNMITIDQEKTLPES